MRPSNLITTDTSKQFMAQKFKQYTINMGIIVKNAPIEANHLISMVERYYGPRRQVYLIGTSKIPGIKPNLAFQIFFQAIKNLIGPHGLIPILLVFGAYFKMTELDVSSLSIS